MLLRTTLYEQVCNIIETRIADGTWPEHSYLPNEFDLSREFKVSIGTIRKAVDILVSERLLERQIGRGTRVTDRRWTNVRNKTDRVRHGEMSSIVNWACTEISRQLVRPNAEIARGLKLRGSDMVEHVRRLRRSTDGTVILDSSYISPAILAVREEAEITVCAASLAVKKGKGLGVVEERCWAVSAPEDVVHIMKIEKGEPLLKMVRILHDRHDQPFEYREALMRSRECYFFTRLE